jgi:hypothetical protein
MATEDNTTISVSDFTSGVTFHGRTASGVPLTTDDFNFTLDANESMIIGFDGAQFFAAGGTATFNDVNGTLISADKPIAINASSYTATSLIAGRDVHMDQLVPESLAGTEYVLIRGGGTSAQHSMETPIVVATEANTDVSIAGAFFANLANAGDYVIINGSNYSTNNNMYIETSKPTMVFQTLLGGVAAGQNGGFNAIPALRDNIPTEVDNIPNITLLSTTTAPGVVGIITKTGATVTFNGAAPTSTAKTVPGTSDWVTYEESGLTGNVSVKSDKEMAVRLSFASGNVGAAGYFSGFAATASSADIDSDGISDSDDGTGDRDGDGIINQEDFDPQGYFYCRDNGQIVTGGSISVVGPAPPTILLDGSTGQYQFVAVASGVYTITFTPPAGTTIDVAFLDPAVFDPSPGGIAGPNPTVLGPGQIGATGVLANLPIPFPSTFFASFDLVPGDPIIINNNVPLTGGACAAAPVVGGDPPIWENIMVFPTPEKFEGRDLNNDGDMNDAVLRYKNLETGAITNTGIAVSQNHRDIDIYGDNIVFVARDESLFSQIRGIFTPYGWIGVFNIKTNQTTMLNVWGDRPSIYENLISISGTELRFYDLNTAKLVETGIDGQNQAIWGDFIAYEASDNTICLYEISSGEVIKTGATGEFPTIHENIVAFENNRELYYYNMETSQVVVTGQAGTDAVVYGDHIVYSNGKKIFYFDIAEQQAFSTGKSGLEPDIFEDIITYYVWEDWKGTDINSDGDRQDPIVSTFTISDSDVAVRMTSANELESAAIYNIQGSLDAQGVTFSVNGVGIESAELEVYSLDGRAIFDSGFVHGSQLRWNLRRQDRAVLANGVYLYRVLVRGANGEVIHSEIRKMLILR